MSSPRAGLWGMLPPVPIHSLYPVLSSFKIFFYLAVSGLSCRVRDLSLRLVGSVVVVHGLSCPLACGTLSSPTRDGTRIPHIGRRVLNHQIVREVPSCSLILNSEDLLLFSCSVVSDSLQPHRLQNAQLPCPLPSPRVCSNSCPLAQ